MGKGPNSGQRKSSWRLLFLGENYGDPVHLSSPENRQEYCIPCFCHPFWTMRKTISKTELTYRAVDNKENSIQIKLNPNHTRLGNCFAFSLSVTRANKISYYLRQFVLVFCYSKLPSLYLAVLNPVPL